MATSFIGIEQTTGTGTTVTLAKPAGVGDGDLLYAVVLVDGNGTISALPSVFWKDRFSQVAFTGNAAALCSAFKYAEAADGASFVFTLSASFTYIAFLVAYRGTERDFADDPVTYPFGIFEVSGGETSKIGTGTSLTTVDTGLPTTGLPYTRLMHVFAQKAATPSFDDVDPLVPIRAKVQTSTLALLLVDVEYEDTISPATDLTVVSSVSDVWATLSETIESYNAEGISLDSYKAKILRKMWPAPFDATFNSQLGRLLTAVGGSDNEIGGLFGVDDFLPDEEP